MTPALRSELVISQQGGTRQSLSPDAVRWGLAPLVMLPWCQLQGRGPGPRSEQGQWALGWCAPVGAVVRAGDPALLWTQKHPMHCSCCCEWGCCCEQGCWCEWGCWCEGECWCEGGCWCRHGCWCEGGCWEVCSLPAASTALVPNTVSGGNIGCARLLHLTLSCGRSLPKRAAGAALVFVPSPCLILLWSWPLFLFLITQGPCSDAAPWLSSSSPAGCGSLRSHLTAAAALPQVLFIPVCILNRLFSPCSHQFYHFP